MAYLVTVVIVKIQAIVRVALELDDVAAQLRQNVLRCAGLVPAPSVYRWARPTAKSSCRQGRLLGGPGMVLKKEAQCCSEPHFLSVMAVYSL